MNEAKKDELRKEIWEISEILFLAQESLKLIDCFLKDEPDESKNYVKKMNTFFAYTMRMNWRLVVIELSKLFSKKNIDEYNLHKFLKKLKKDGHYGDANIPESFILKTEDYLRKEQNVINNLIDQRDKVYAHTDKKSKKIKNNVSLVKIKELVQFVQNIIRQIYQTTFETSILIDQPIGSPLDNLNYILDILTTEKLEREKALHDLISSYGITI